MTHTVPPMMRPLYDFSEGLGRRRRLRAAGRDPDMIISSEDQCEPSEQKPPQSTPEMA